MPASASSTRCCSGTSRRTTCGKATDIWSLVTASGSPSAGASPARMVEFATRQAATGTGATPMDREIVTCRTRRHGSTPCGTPKSQRAGTVFGRRIFPDARTDALARAELLAALPASHDFLIGAARSAGEIMRQQMVLNAVHDAGEQWAAEAGNAAALRAYTEARAEAQTVSAYRAIGRQAETWVPLLRIVFECLYVGAFPMAVLLMLTPAGGAIFRSYVTGLVWLQSWGPLYAVLHRISMGEAAERMQAAALMPGGDIGISLVAQAGIRAVASDVAVMSGYLSMSVPFLAAALAYGLSKATVLATSVLAVGQDAASSAAHEGTTGNLSLANTGYDTHRFATLEGRQIRTSAHVDTDRFTSYAPAGAAFTVAGDGTPDCRCRGRHQPHSRPPGSGSRSRWRPATRRAPRMPQPLAALVGGGGPGAQRRGHRRDGADRALQPRRLHGRGVCARRHRERERPGPGAGGALRQDVGDGRAHEEPDGGARRRGEGRRRLGLHRQARRRRLGVVARPDDREGILGRREGLCREPPGHRPLVERFRSVAALLHRDRGERGGEPRREPVGQPQPHADVPGTRIARAPGIGELVGAGSPGALGRAGNRARARPALLRVARGAAGHGRARHRRRRRHAHRLAADGGGRRAAPGTRRRVHRRTVPRARGAGPGSVGGAAEYEGAAGELREAYTRETAAAYGGWSEGVRDRAYVAGAPIPGEVEAAALGERAETKTEQIMKETAREARTGIAREDAREGRAGVAAETNRPFEEHATENLPVIGDWLAGKLYGTAKNAVPDGAPGGAGKDRPGTDQRDWGDASP